jgi:hypothetical protein
MELVLVLVILVVMYATMRSVVVGLLTGVVLGAMLVPAGGRAAVFTAAGVASAGFLLGVRARSQASPARAVLLAAVPLGLALGAWLAADEAASRASLDEWVRLHVGDALTAAWRSVLVEYLPELLPAIGVLVGFGLVLLSYALAVRLFRPLGVEPRPLGRLGELRLPFAVVWSFAAALLLGVVGRGAGVRWLLLAGLNLSFVHGAAFFVEGLAIGRHVLEARAMPGPMQLVFGLVALMMPMPLVVGGVGFFDLWFDFRRLAAPPANGEGAGQ